MGLFGPNGSYGLSSLCWLLRDCHSHPSLNWNSDRNNSLKHLMHFRIFLQLLLKGAYGREED